MDQDIGGRILNHTDCSDYLNKFNCLIIVNNRELN